MLAYVEVPGVFSANIRHRQLLAVSAATDVKAIRAESVERVKKVRWVLFFFFGLFFLFVCVFFKIAYAAGVLCSAVIGLGPTPLPISPPPR